MNVEDLKSIPICDLFYRIALDTARPLPKTSEGNKYIFVAIDHYFKWCEAKAIPNHTTMIVARFLEKYIICRYEVLKFILINNGGEWSTKFDNMCKVYNIHHQYTTPKWPRCNKMVEWIIKTIKHEIIMMSTFQEIQATRIYSYPWCCLVIDVGSKQAQSSFPLWC